MAKNNQRAGVMLNSLYFAGGIRFAGTTPNRSSTVCPSEVGYHFYESPTEHRLSCAQWGWKLTDLFDTFYSISSRCSKCIENNNDNLRQDKDIGHVKNSVVDEYELKHIHAMKSTIDKVSESST